MVLGMSWLCLLLGAWLPDVRAFFLGGMSQHYPRYFLESYGVKNTLIWYKTLQSKNWFANSICSSRNWLESNQSHRKGGGWVWPGWRRKAFCIFFYSHPQVHNFFCYHPRQQAILYRLGKNVQKERWKYLRRILNHIMWVILHVFES